MDDPQPLTPATLAAVLAHTLEVVLGSELIREELADADGSADLLDIESVEQADEPLDRFCIALRDGTIYEVTLAMCTQT